MVPLRYNLRSLAVRRRTTAAAAFGIALVVFVLAGALMLSNGIEQTLGKAGKPDNAIVLRKGSDAELSSGIEEARINLVLAQPGVQKGSDGKALGTAEVVVVAAMDKIGTSGVSNVEIRGVPDNVMAVRPEIHIVDGRAPKPGTDEAMVGRRIRGRFKGLDLGQAFEVRHNHSLQVVGVFESGGSSSESEVWADVNTVRTAFGREGAVSSITVRLTDPAAFDGFKAAIEQDKQLGLDVMRETDFMERQSEDTAMFIKVIGIVISVFFSLGAMIGATITMYAQVASRGREIGILRALGFSRFAILFAFLMESIALALVGGVIGIGASLLLGMVEFSMVNFASWSEIVFTFTPTPGILTAALIFAGGMGVVGGFFPAIRASRVSPIRAIRG